MLSDVRTVAEEPLGRATCLECFRPESLCFCGYVPQVITRTRVVIFQHPREQFHSLGTARLVELALPNSEVVRGNLEQQRRKVASVLARAREPYLVFPSPEAVDVAEVDVRSTPGSLVLLDGTWPLARALLREMPELMALPKVQFTPSLPSNYRIRRPPRPEYVSTLESIVEVLSVLEPEAEPARLRAFFGRFIDENISARAIGQAPPRRKLRRARPSAVPLGLKASLERALVVYAEKNSASTNWEIDSVRLRPSEPALALPRLNSFSKLLQFVQDGEVIIAWSKHTLDQLRARGSQTLCLKEAFCNHWQRSRLPQAAGLQGIEGAVEREGLSSRRVGPTGEAANPLQSSVALWRRLIEIHLSES